MSQIEKLVIEFVGQEKNRDIRGLIEESHKKLKI